MGNDQVHLKVNLLGPLSITSLDGDDLTPRGRKSKALVAMLAVAPDGRRGRKWLQGHLWSDRQESQGSASLRQSLREIRKSFGDFRDIISADATVVSLDLSRVSLDIDEQTSGARDLTAKPGEIRDFLEGMDIRDEEFSNWLQDQRSYWKDYFERLRPNRRNLPEKSEATPIRRPDLGRLELGTEHFPGPGTDTYSTTHFSPLMGELLGSRNQTGRRVRRQAVAIAPLLNKTGDPRLEYAADGISEDLLERMARLCWLPVIARSSTFGFRAEDRDLIAIGDQVDARYVVDGDLFLHDNAFSLRIRLTNAESGLAMWSQRFEIGRSHVGEAVDAMLSEIVGTIDSRIDVAEQRRSTDPRWINGDFDDHIWRGRWYMHKLTQQGAQVAKQHFDAAMDIIPDAPEALIQMALWHLWRIWNTRGSFDEIDHVRLIAERAKMSDSTDGRGFTLVGIAETWMGQHDEAIQSLQRAIELNPSLTKAHQQLGTTHYLAGDPQSAIEPLDTAIRLSPNDQHLFIQLGEMAMAQLMRGDMKKAIDYANHALLHRPNYWYAHLVRICASEELGDADQIGRAVSAFATTETRLTERHFEWVPFRDRKWIRKLRNTAESAIDRAYMIQSQSQGGARNGKAD